MLKDFIMKGRQRSAMLVALFLFVVVAFAVPAKPGLTRLLPLTDGSTVNAMLVGDEYLHYWLGEDGKAYQAVSKQERGSKGGSKDGDAVYQTFDLEAAKKSADERRSSANQQRARRLAPRKVGNVGNISGNKKGIIILVNFQDVTFTATQSDFYNLANTVNYNSGNFKGSMYDYFYAQSDGQFRLTFDVVGPYTVSQNCAYYGANDSKGNDVRPGYMVKEAVQLANDDVNFADYDWDGDGYVDQVYVVYAGKGEADGGADDTIWPHEWALSSATDGYITLDGKKINTYACGGEQNGKTGETAGIGTMCHEFSHCLGYPDFYDTDYSGGQGMFEWDLMDSGSYNGNGYRPAGYTSYERWVAGWKTPTELEYTQNINNMAALQTTASDTYIIYNKANRNEYYLLENRQKTGWDASLPGKGLLILHVDYSSSAWSNNQPNDDPSHQRMTWIAADNEYQYTVYQGNTYYTEAGAANDPFPYGSVNAFGKNTTPAATLYNNNSDGTKYLDSSITDITQNSDGTISFNFQGIDMPIPTGLALSEVGATSFTVSWAAVDDAEFYEIDIVKGSSFEASADGIVLQSDFSSTTGWTLSGTDTYTGTGYCGQSSPAIKFDGTGDYAISPDFGCGTKLQFWAYGNGGSGSTFAISGLINDTWTAIETVTIAQNGDTYEVNLPNGTSQVRFDFTKSVNCALDDVVVYGPGNSPVSVDGYPKSVGNVTSYAITGLTASTEYAVRVRAVNVAVNSDWSTAATTTTAEEEPADPTIAYYQNADGKTGAALKTALCGIIYNRTELGYDDLWTAYQSTDVRSDGKIWDMYSNITNYDPVNGSHSNSAEGSGFNREHSFPKSWFGGEIMPMYTDLHHLYPVDGNINTRRSNNPYGETSSPTYTSSGDFSKLGTCTYPGYTGTVFEPNDEYKGDFARTYFYMVTCYEEKLADWVTNYSATTEVDDVLDGTTYPSLTTWQLNMLMKWAKDDPVSEKETNRNNAVFAIQNNRNPFIDYPGLEEYIWGSQTDVMFSYDNYLQPARLSFSATEATATLGEDFIEPTLTTTPSGLTVTYSSSNTNVATVDASTGEVTLVDAGSTSITATFAGNDSYSGGTASYTLTVSNPALVMGETLLYEGVTTYSSTGDSGTALTKSNSYLNYGNWNTLTNIYPGGTSNAHSNGGCLKFGSSNAAGSMTTGNIMLTSGGILTFYLKKFSSDSGQLKVTVEGDYDYNEEITPTSDWTLCTVKFPEDTGNITIKLESTKRVYVDEIKLTGNGTLDLVNDGNNASIIAAAAENGGKFNVTLKDRTLYRDGNWNTLCLPFNFDLDATNSPISGYGITVMAFDETTSTFENGTLTLNFTTVFDNDTYKGNLVAGTPYLIKWDVDTNNPTITDPVFYGMTIDATTRNKTCDLGDGNSISFCGTYERLTYDNDDHSILFLGEENMLYYPESGATIGAQRAYFQLTGIEAKASAPGNGGNGPLRAFVLNFGDDKSNGIENVHSSMFNVPSEDWYTLDGRRLNGKPTKKGIYVNGNRKVLIK